MTAVANEPFELLHASTDRVRIVDTPVRRMLAIDGIGSVGGPAFGAAIEALFSTGYALMFTRRKATGVGHPVGHLEGLYWLAEGDLFGAQLPQGAGEMHWRLLLELPPGASQSEVDAAVEHARTKRPGGPFDGLHVVALAEGRSAQILHVGPYDDEPRTVARLMADVAADGFRVSGPHHEIYLGDPRRSAPERLRTIIRYPVRPAG